MSATSTPPPGEPPSEQPQNIATALAEVSERATLLVHEEIELAKAEVAEKIGALARGAVVGVTAGIFLVTALVFFLVGCAWLLYYYLPGNDFTYFWGFFAMAVILVLLGIAAGGIAAKVVKKAAPPVPSMAIDEARKIRETVSASEDASRTAAGPTAPGPAAAAGSSVPLPAPADGGSPGGASGEPRS